ncbi:hypothetical protein [Actinocorallia longicatena]
MKNLVGRWHRATGDVVSVVRARMRQLEEREVVWRDLMAHPDLAALDRALDHWYGDGLSG